MLREILVEGKHCNLMGEGDDGNQAFKAWL